MKRKRILTVLIVLALVFIWGNSLVSRELSGKISDDILFFLNAAAEKVGLGPDAFTYMTDEDGDGVAEQPTSHLIRKAAHVTEYAVFAALLFLRLESAGEKRFCSVVLACSRVSMASAMASYSVFSAAFCSVSSAA